MSRSQVPRLVAAIITVAYVAALLILATRYPTTGTLVGAGAASVGALALAVSATLRRRFAETAAAILLLGGVAAVEAPVAETVAAALLGLASVEAHLQIRRSRTDRAYHRRWIRAGIPALASVALVAAALLFLPRALALGLGSLRWGESLELQTASLPALLAGLALLVLFSGDAARRLGAASRKPDEPTPRSEAAASGAARGPDKNVRDAATAAIRIS